MASCVIEEITDAPDPQEEGPSALDVSGGDGGAAARDAQPSSSSGATRLPGAAAAGPEGSPPMVAPEDCEAVTPDRGVLKAVLAEGAGDKPCLHARCLGERREGADSCNCAQAGRGPGRLNHAGKSAAPRAMPPFLRILSCGGLCPTSPAAREAAGPAARPRLTPAAMCRPRYPPTPAPGPFPPTRPPPPASPLHRLPRGQWRCLLRHAHGEREPGARDPRGGPR
jgi:hypothetical protein